MRLTSPAAQVFVPTGGPEGAALTATRVLGIGAHPDDLEIMSWHAIATGTPGYTGVVVADGADSPRAGRFAALSGEEMKQVRLEEQRRAALLGGYAALVYLGYPSREVKQGINPAVVRDLAAVVEATRPAAIYTHSPCDVHDTHVAVVMHLVQALRGLPAVARPRALYGCEVWGSLDWLVGPERLSLDVGAHEQLGCALVSVFESQIAGGKRYDHGSLGRRRANATFSAPRQVDTHRLSELALDLTPLVQEPWPDPVAWVQDLWRRAEEEAAARLRRFR